MKNFLKNIFHSFSRNQGQGLVEYGLLMIIVVFATAYVFYAEDETGKALKNTILGNSSSSVNPKQIKTPEVPTGSSIWNPEIGYAGKEGILQKPIAFFTLPHTVYVGETITYRDSSFDPDGEIVERIWEGKQTSFNSEGDYVIKLTVKDNDDLTDTFTVTVKVRKRDTYSRILHDMPNETRQVINESPIYNKGQRKEFILDHRYGKRNDLYGVEHLVIEQNYWETVQEKARDITYEVKIPLVEVTYDSTGREISRKPYVKDGVTQYYTQTDTEVVPQPAERKVEWKNNTWTYYVYDRKSSVQNSGGSWGSRGPSADYTRFYPEVQKTRQDPAFISSRNTTKDNAYSPGYNATTASGMCPTCTVPNEVNRKEQYQTQGNPVSCVYGNTYKTTHDRTYNWIDHRAYDVVYRYSGTNTANPNYVRQELTRNTWKTEGWQASEQVGTPAIVRLKYTNCQGAGENCWNPLNTSETFYGNWSVYNTGTDYDYDSRRVRNGTDSRGNPIYKDESRSRSRTVYYERREARHCYWYGKDATGNNWNYEYNHYYGSYGGWSSWS